VYLVQPITRIDHAFGDLLSVGLDLALELLFLLGEFFL
jgi:hypothetical protein